MVPNLELSIFLMTVDVNLLISLMGVKLTALLCSDFGVDLFLSADSNKGFLLNGVALGAADFADGFAETTDFVVDDFDEEETVIFFFS